MTTSILTAACLRSGVTICCGADLQFHRLQQYVVQHGGTHSQDCNFPTYTSETMDTHSNLSSIAAVVPITAAVSAHVRGPLQDLDLGQIGGQLVWDPPDLSVLANLQTLPFAHGT